MAVAAGKAVRIRNQQPALARGKICLGEEEEEGRGGGGGGGV